MIQNINVVHHKCSFELRKNDVHLANAIRRSLISDVESYAPNKVVFEVNTTCQTDEYIAHRIGLVPFCTPEFNEEDTDIRTQTVTFDCKDKTFDANQMSGSFQPAQNIPIIKVIQGQHVKGTIFFAKKAGKDHSRFCPIAAAGYQILKDKINFTFESINGENPINHLLQALKKLQSRLNNVKYQIECSKKTESMLT